MDRLRLADLRSPNTMADVARFRGAWEGGEPLAYPRDAPPLRSSGCGNLNAGGVLRGTFAPPRTVGDPQFLACIEVAVRPLVAVLAVRAGLVTYTSCEGHWYGAGDADATPLHVGVLPRSDAELGRAAAWMVASIGDARDLVLARPALAFGTLLDEASGSLHAVVDLYLLRVPGASWRAYFEARERNVRHLTALLERFPPDVALPGGASPAQAASDAGRGRPRSL